MANGQNGNVVRLVHTVFTAGTVAGLSDGQLLAQFAARSGDAAELAFSALVERHGPMVLRVCRGILRDEHDAQDAFQATFLVLARKAGSLWARDSLGPWLYGVAFRTASCARSAEIVRREHEQRAAELMTRVVVAEEDWDDRGRVLHEEVSRLPERYRRPILLCYFEGLTHDQAASQLNWPVGTVRSRLFRARERLRTRLTRRGIAPDAAYLHALSFRLGSLPANLINPTVKAAMLPAVRKAVGAGLVSASAAAMMEGVLRTMFVSKLNATATTLLAVGAITFGMGLYARQEKVEEPPTAAEQLIDEVGMGLNPRQEKVQEPPTAAEQLIDEALAKITKLQSVSAELVEEVQLLKEKVTIKGRYLKASNARVYFRLTVGGHPDTEETTLQVCDGETLWDYQQARNSQLYRKFSVKPILERLNSPDLDSKIKEQVMTQMGLAGPETLVVGLRRAIRFEHKEEGALGGKKVWILRGSCRNRQGLAGPDGQPVLLNGLLPPYIPSDASLCLGKDDGWPYKLVLTGRPLSVLLNTGKAMPAGRRIGSLSSLEKPDPTKLTLEYTNVKLNAAIPVDEFAFQAPSTAQVDDNTEVIVRMLDLGITMQARRNKAEAAKKEGRVLEQPIEIPRP
jgi:RNA polymerase sigma factor (sigma-70 family)